jgi:hypothetical protein
VLLYRGSKSDASKCVDLYYVKEHAPLDIKELFDPVLKFSKISNINVALSHPKLLS